MWIGLNKIKELFSVQKQHVLSSFSLYLSIYLYVALFIYLYLSLSRSLFRSHSPLTLLSHSQSHSLTLTRSLSRSLSRDLSSSLSLDLNRSISLDLYLSRSRPHYGKGQDLTPWWHVCGVPLSQPSNHLYICRSCAINRLLCVSNTTGHGWNRH